MKRIVATLAVMALLLAAMAAPAFAVTNPHSNCLGEFASALNQPHDPDYPPGSGGDLVSEVAREGTIGEAASNNCEG
jgi:hypothetical protein